MDLNTEKLVGGLPLVKVYFFLFFYRAHILINHYIHQIVFVITTKIIRVQDALSGRVALPFKLTSSSQAKQRGIMRPTRPSPNYNWVTRTIWLHLCQCVIVEEDVLITCKPISLKLLYNFF
jgi:hypothetical protein